ncbi:MAG TPA: hypothetical protein VNQ14_01485 [Woeseiaceae bacterium]|nr:hypothetical protein [Woeseiaceae bacterium]
MNVRPFAIYFGYTALALVGALPLQAVGEHQQNGSQQKHLSEFVKVVRDATRDYRDVTMAEAAGYQLHFGCVSDDDEGGMGMHFVNMALVGDGVLDATLPEIVIYEPRPNGRLKLIGADYLVLAEAWDAMNDSPPQLMGQLFHLFPSPNRFGLPPFYTLHVWAWKDNPGGTFVNWHPKVSCDAFDGQQH